MYVESLIVSAFFTSEGIAFHITGPEYDRLSLNKLVLGIGIVKLLFEADCNDLYVKVFALNWKRSFIYWGAKTLTTLYILLALFRRTA